MANMSHIEFQDNEKSYFIYLIYCQYMTTSFNLYLEMILKEWKRNVEVMKNPYDSNKYFPNNLLTTE